MRAVHVIPALFGSLVVATAASAQSAQSAQSAPAGFLCELAPPGQEVSKSASKTLVLGSASGFNGAAPVLFSDEGRVLGGANSLRFSRIAAADGRPTFGFTTGTMTLIIKQSPNQPDYYNAVLGVSPSRATHVGLCHHITGAPGRELVAILSSNRGSSSQ